MFDVGFSELVLLAIVALVVLGPEKLPHAARVAGAWVGRIRRTISTMQAEIEREVGAQEIKTRMEKEFGASTAASFVQQLGADLQQEKQAIEGELRQTENSIADAISTHSSSTPPSGTTNPPGTSHSGMAAATASALAGAVDAPPAPLLAEIATPLHEVNMDGEAAYRQWLDSQKRSKAERTDAESGNTAT
jgi:sec-independent protein translocase protein TatB